MDSLAGWPKADELQTVEALRDAALSARNVFLNPGDRGKELSAWKWVRDVGNHVPYRLGSINFQPHIPADPYHPHGTDFLAAANTILQWCDSDEAAAIANRPTPAGGEHTEPNTPSDHVDAAPGADTDRASPAEATLGDLIDAIDAGAEPEDLLSRFGDPWRQIHSAVRTFYPDISTRARVQLNSGLFVWLDKNYTPEGGPVPLAELRKMSISEVADLLDSGTSAEIICIANGQLYISDEPFRLTDPESNVLEAIAEQGAMEKGDLENKSGQPDAVNILKRLSKKYPALKVRTPGGKGKGGYWVNIKWKEHRESE